MSILLLTLGLATGAFAEEAKTVQTGVIPLVSEEGKAEEVLISKISFEGNARTQPRTMLQELGFKVGDQVSAKDLERGRQAIMDLGLFKSVKLHRKAVSGGEEIVIKVREKHYWFILPRGSRSGDGDISLGMTWKIDNLWGLNHESKLILQHTDYKDTDRDNEWGASWKYKYPRVRGSLFNLRFKLGAELSDLDEERGELAGEYERELEEFDVGLSRWLNKTGRSRGWEAGASLGLQSYSHKYLKGDEGLFFDADILSLGANVRYYQVEDHLYNREGLDYGYNLELSEEGLGSDVSYTFNNLYFRGYFPITKRKYTNLNMQFRLGHASRTIFGDPYYGIGGSTRLRGYSRTAIEGDDFVLGNIEFLRPIGGHSRLRGVVFTDFGGAWDQPDEFSAGDIEFAAGIGLRWKLVSFVKVDLRLDFAHGFGDEGKNRFYIGTDSTF
ncbi:MAG: BamA/TamA family outer membrane protein [Pseudomonadota bacterium]|nr:BamA/TamA family outer membrane protein [Pseudomonadota bacterium]